MKEVIKKISLIGCSVLFFCVFSQSCLAENYNVTNESTLNSALTNTSASDKTLNVSSNINVTSNLQTLQGTNITINGNHKTLDGGSKTGVTVKSSQTLNLYNYGDQSNGTVTNAVQNFYRAGYGGVIYNTGGKVNIYNSIFENNSSNGEAGVLFSEGGNSEITSSDFINNHSTSYSGAVGISGGTATIDDSTFIGNYATRGGALDLYDMAAVYVNNSTFEGNGVSGYDADTPSAGTTVSSDGGAIYNENSSTVTIKDSIFKYNRATIHGGAISNIGIVKAITGSTFTSNATTASTNSYGGAIFNSSTIRLIDDTTFTSNYTSGSAGRGGAIYNTGTIGLVSNSEFNSNYASNNCNGGAIYNTGTIKLDNTTFTSNNSGLGGAIYNTGNLNIYRTLGTTTFSGNSSLDGGAIANIEGGALTVYNSIFEGNHVSVLSGAENSGVGGAIVNGNLVSNVSTVANIYNSTFTNNYAGLGGGAVVNVYNSSSGTTLSIYDSTFTGNYTTESSSTRLSGGAFANMNAISYIEDSTFEGNGLQNYNTTTKTGTVKTAYGGAVANYWDSDNPINTSSTITIKDATFKYNSVTNSGGAIYNETEAGTSSSSLGKSNVTIDASTFTSNSAGNEGGAIANYTEANYTEAKVDVFNSTFTSNTATNNGGAILNKQTSGLTNAIASMNIKNSTFTSNSSGVDGGAISNQYGTMTIEDSTFESNHAKYGGAINNNAGALTVKYSTFKNNDTVLGQSTLNDVGGGAIRNYLGTLTIKNSIFQNNTGYNYSENNGGGAISNVSGTVNIVGDNGVTSFIGNKDGISGTNSNDIYMRGGALNLYAGDSGYVKFASGISGSSYDINVNPVSSDYAHNGIVIFDCSVANANMNLYNGVLTLGEFTTGTLGANGTTNYFSNSSLNLAGGVLNSVNGSIDTVGLNSLNISSNSGLFIDWGDRISNSSVSGTGYLLLDAVNFATEPVTLSYNVLSNNPTNFSVSNLTVYSAGTSTAYKYTPSLSGGSLSLAQASNTYGTTLADTFWSSSVYKSLSLTGNYTSNDVNIGWMSGNMTTIFGNNYSLDGNGSSGVILSNNSISQNLNILDVGYATTSDADGDGIIDTVTVRDSMKNFNNDYVSFGGVVYNNGENVTVMDSVFESNTAPYSSGVFYNNTGAYGTSVLNISDSVFSKNYVPSGSGGVIGNYAGSIANITNSVFYKNYATGYGGAIYNGNDSTLNVYGSTFLTNGINYNTSIASTQKGGAIYNGGTAEIYNSNFYANAVTQNGGAIFNGSGLSVYNSIFKSNTAPGYGGAIENDGTISTIYNTTFISNSAVAGGAIINQGGTITTMDDVTFTTNYASGDGGAYCNSGVTTTIKGSAFTGNHAGNRGGAIFSYDGTSIGTIDNTTFTNNYATNGGGAIYNIKEMDTIKNSTFTGNYTTSSSSSGGAIYHKSNSAMAINSSTFEGNGINGYDADDLTAGTTSTKSGGAIYNGNGTGAVTVNNSLFKNNAAISFGGAIYNSDGIVNLANTQFNNNNAGTGGAIYNYGATLSVDNSTLTNNIASTGSGGAIVNDGYDSESTVTISKSIFSDNSAKYYGGAIYNSDTASLYINNSKFTGNGIQSGATVTSYGGAIANLESAANTTIVNSIFTGNKATTAGGAIYNDSATLNIIADAGNTTFSGNYANNSLNDIYLNESSTLNLNAGNGGKITFGGGIVSNDSTNIININKTGTYKTDASTSNTSPTDGEVVLNGAITGDTGIIGSNAVANVNLYGGTLTLGKDSYLNNTALTLAGGTLNMQNSVASTMSLNSLAVTGNTNIKIDVDLAKLRSDGITSANPVTSSAKLNISSINVLSDLTGPSVMTRFLESSLAGKDLVTLGVTKAYTPIYAYNVSYNDTTGDLAFSRGGGGSGGGGDYNPAILSSPVSTNVGAYMSQVGNYSQILDRSELFMSLPYNERVLMRYQNKLAAIGGSDAQPEVFSPTFLPDENGGLWFKQYTTFENVPLNNGGPNVSNVAYGLLVGGDAPMQHFKNGWDGYTTVYVAYNGSYQNYDQVGASQNGGALGITETLYKGNFFTALTASAGDSYGRANTMYGVDNFNTILAGLAWKLGYNIEMARGKFILQPSLLTSYTFAKTFDYTTASGVNVTSDPLNAMQVAPGLKFIYNAKNGWQPYLAANMVFNIMDTQKFYANDAALPTMSIAPYFEYGAGVQRRWGDRFTGFGQFMLRGGGRNGIALMFGFRIALGK